MARIIVGTCPKLRSGIDACERDCDVSLGCVMRQAFGCGEPAGSDADNGDPIGRGIVQDGYRIGGGGEMRAISHIRRN